MLKIGRNDPCPCGSGKKYKQCCLRNKINPVGKYDLPYGIKANAYSQEDVLKPLISSSKSFKNFYRSEKANLGNDFHWIKSSYDIETKLGFRRGQMGKSYRLVGKNDVERFIVLEKIPPSIRDDQLIAHEMMHDIVFNEGFPAVAAINPNPFSQEEYSNRIQIASALSSMIHDILCDSRLKEYGFSFDEIYKTKISGILTNLDKLTYDPLDKFAKSFYVYQYCLTIMQGNLIATGSKDEFDKYKQIYVQKFPEITTEGDLVLELINDIGFETPTNLTRLFQEILKRHDFENKFQLS